MFLQLAGAVPLAASGACGRKPGAPPAPLRAVRVRPLQAISTRERFDVCVIGSGMAGAVVAKRLIESGRRVLVLESGYAPNQGHDRLGGLEVFEGTGDFNYPFLATRMRALGGTTNLWSGGCVTYTPLDFEARGWPIRYSDIAPYYARAERTLNVKIPDFDRLGGLWQRSPNPQLDEMFAARDLVSLPTPKSRSRILSEGPVRARIELLPPVSESEQATIVTGATVTRLHADRSRNVVAAEAHDLGGVTRRIEAQVFVLAAGAVESARLLLLSRSQAFPGGVGNDHDQVGRHFMEDVDQLYTADLHGLRIKYGQRAICVDFYDEFLRRGLGGVYLVFTLDEEVPGTIAINLGIKLLPSAENRVTLAAGTRDILGNPAPALEFSARENDRVSLDAGRRLLRELCADFGAKNLALEPGFHFSHHHMGTCRMGSDPRTSVVDGNLRVHGLQNLYVLGSGVFRAAGRGHPTLLITALAHRLADQLTSAPLTSAA